MKCRKCLQFVLEWMLLRSNLWQVLKVNSQLYVASKNISDIEVNITVPRLLFQIPHTVRILQVQPCLVSKSLKFQVKKMDELTYLLFEQLSVMIPLQ